MILILCLLYIITVLLLTFMPKRCPRCGKKMKSVMYDYGNEVYYCEYCAKKKSKKEIEK